MFELVVETEFSAAHQICDYPGACARLHGHNYRVVAVVAGEQLDELGMLVDFAVLKRLLAEIAAPLDHQNLNDLPLLAGINPTSEQLARYFHRGLAPRLPAGVRVAAVTVYESARSGATYRA